MSTASADNGENAWHCLISHNDMLLQEASRFPSAIVPQFSALASSVELYITDRLETIQDYLHPGLSPGLIVCSSNKVQTGPPPRRGAIDEIKFRCINRSKAAEELPGEVLTQRWITLRPDLPRVRATVNSAGRLRDGDRSGKRISHPGRSSGTPPANSLVER